MPKLDELLLGRWLIGILIDGLSLDLSVRFSGIDCLVMVTNLLLLDWRLTQSDISLDITLLCLSAFLTKSLDSLISV